MFDIPKSLSRIHKYIICIKKLAICELMTYSKTFWKWLRNLYVFIPINMNITYQQLQPLQPSKPSTPLHFIFNYNPLLAQDRFGAE